MAFFAFLRKLNNSVPEREIDENTVKTVFSVPSVKFRYSVLKDFLSRNKDKFHRKREVRM